MFTVPFINVSGPLPETIGHFWTMIWQQQVSAIVMLCRLTESGICKCARYWPATTEEDDLIHVPNAGLEVRLRDFDDQDKDFSVSQSFFTYFIYKVCYSAVVLIRKFTIAVS